MFLSTIGGGALPRPFANTITPPVEGSGRASARRLRTREATADYFQVVPQTIDNWHGAGRITAYKVGPRRLLFDLDEIERAFKRYPGKMRDGRKRGAQGRVVPLTLVEAVTDKDQP